MSDLGNWASTDAALQIGCAGADDPLMQDLHAGAVGDFMKLGLLRWLAAPSPFAPRPNLGVVWYRVPDERRGVDSERRRGTAPRCGARNADPASCIDGDDDGGDTRDDQPGDDGAGGGGGDSDGDRGGDESTP